MKRAGGCGGAALIGLAILILAPGAVRGAACTAPSLVWQDQWNGAEGYGDEARGVAVDASGNIFVVGSEQTLFEGFNWKIIKYDSAGNITAEAGYNQVTDNGDDVATAVAVDSSGNVWVVGYETYSDPVSGWGPQYDWRMRKYSNDLSTVLADISYDYYDPNWSYDPLWETGWWNDKAWAVAIDSSNNVYVGGEVSDWGVSLIWPNAGENYNPMVRKYDSDGVFTGSFYTRDNADYRVAFGNYYGYDDAIYSLSFDSTGNLVCGGIVGYGFGPNNFSYVVKLDSSLGYVTHNEITSYTLNDAAWGVAVDQSDDTVILVGRDDLCCGNYDWGLRKLPSNVNLAPIWYKPYSGLVGGADAAKAVAMAGRNPIVAGYSMEDFTFTLNWMIRMLDPGGNLLWSDTYSNGDFVSESANAVTMDQTGFVVVGTVDDGMFTGFSDWRVVKYAIPACLDASLSAVPASTCVGSNIELVLTVTNNGRAAATSVSATLSLDAGESAVTLVSGPVPADIPGNSAVSFTWVYAATANGTLAFTATAQGTDSSGVAGYLEAVSTGLSAQSIQTASLSSMMTVDPIGPGVAEQFEVILTVNNAVGSAANGVEATMWIDSGGSLISIVGGPDPAPVTIPSGGAQSFTWTWATLSSGLASFTASVTGVDACAGGTVATDSSGSVVIGGASLEAALAVVPPSSCVGKQLEVHLTVTNGGSGNADAVSATLSLDAGGSNLSLFAADTASYVMGPGTSRTFIWSFSVTGSPSVDFTATVTGTDLATMAPIGDSLTSPSIPLLLPGSLAGAVSVVPPSLLAGNWVDVVLSVTNTGQMDMQGVQATMWFDSGGGLLELVSGPSPAPVVINPAGSQYFTWTWSASGGGVVNFSASATGEDACQGVQLATAYTGSVVVPGVSFSSAIKVIPSPACVGRWIDVHFTVTNSGSGNATNVSATLSIDVGGSIVEMVSADAGPLVIPPFSAHTFTWTLSASGTPTVSFTATAVGSDLSTMMSVTTFKSSAAVTVLLPAILSGAVSVSPSSLLSGNWYTVVLSVTNNGQMDATGVSATMWFNSGDGLSELIAGPDPAPLLIPPAGSQYFTWTWSASGKGVPSFTASATGTDACKGWSVTAGGTGTVTLLSPGVLEGSLVATPSVQVINNWVEAILTLTNTGSTDVVNITVTDWITSGQAFAAKVLDPPPGPVTLAPGASANFTWTYNGLAAGTVNLTVSFTGTELTKGTPLSGQLTGSFNIVSEATLCTNVAVTPLTAISGQNVQVVATVVNCGPAGGLSVRNVMATPPPLGVCPATPFIQALLGGTATVTPVTTPAAACSLLAPGQSAKYTWVYTVGGDGTVDFTVTFTGEQDMAFGTEVSGGASRRLTVGTPSALAAALDLVPSCGGPCTAKYGDIIKVALTATNPSSGAADGVYALTQTVTGTAKLTRLTAPSERRYIPGYSAYSYVWTYRVDGAGTANFLSQAVGQDFILLNPVISNEAALALTIPAPPAVDVAVDAPAAVVAGQQVSLTVRVQNLSSTQVALSAFGESGDAGDLFTIDSSEPLLPRTLEVGETREFTVKVKVNTAAAAGTAGFSLRALALAKWSGETVLSEGGAVTLEVVADNPANPGGVVTTPNPWRAGTGDLLVRYAVTPAQSGYPVSVRIYNLSGELVKTLVDETKAANVYEARWDGKNRWGQKVASGIYLVLVETRSSRQVRKLAVIR